VFLETAPRGRTDSALWTGGAVRLHELRSEHELALLDRAHGRQPTADIRRRSPAHRPDDPRAGRARSDRSTSARSRLRIGDQRSRSLDDRRPNRNDPRPYVCGPVSRRARLRPGRTSRLRVRRKRRRGDGPERCRSSDRNDLARRRSGQRSVRLRLGSDPRRRANARRDRRDRPANEPHRVARASDGLCQRPQPSDRRKATARVRRLRRRCAPWGLSAPVGLRAVSGCVCGLREICHH
jgi:hypothetical protein